MIRRVGRREEKRGEGIAIHFLCLDILKTKRKERGVCIPILVWL